jgi:hypothetical protein
MPRSRLISTVILLVSGTSAYAQGSLNTTDRPVLWAATISRGGGPAHEVPECTPGCQRFELRLNLPDDVWKHRRGGVQIAIRWFGLVSAMAPAPAFQAPLNPNAAQGETLGDNLKLYVYRGKSRIAASDGSTALAQSVIINEPSNGLLLIYVVYDAASPADRISYEGLAEVEYQADPKPLRRLLPDLEFRAQRHVTFDPGRIFPDAIDSTYPSCYFTEVEEEGARLCLRFDQVFANTGEGPLEVRFQLPRDAPPGRPEAFQRVYLSDGPKRFENLSAGQVEFHPTHAHYHLMTFAVSRLWRVESTDSKSVPPAHAPGPVQVVRSSPKLSFCMVDTEIDRWAKKGDGPRTWKAPDCLLPESQDDQFQYFAQGLTQGWNDIYEWYLPHQYIDVAGLTDGLYILETRADPENRLIEVTKSNNCGTVYLRLTRMGSTSPAAEIVGPGPQCEVLIDSRR